MTLQRIARRSSPLGTASTESRGRPQEQLTLRLPLTQRPHMARYAQFTVVSQRPLPHARTRGDASTNLLSACVCLTQVCIGLLCALASGTRQLAQSGTSTLSASNCREYTPSANSSYFGAAGCAAPVYDAPTYPHPYCCSAAANTAQCVPDNTGARLASVSCGAYTRMHSLTSSSAQAPGMEAAAPPRGSRHRPAARCLARLQLPQPHQLTLWSPDLQQDAEQG